ncbi:putative transcriptional regulatory protein TcrX [Roseibaca ekhonensis]|jgi:DNA-binding response OmpR family regulator|uniref:Putative transcriptional regulatory protein TcrX n=1 Tax=Roseinatronobacter ekhonensis TaxID=254356 RepID=A0A3B0MF83_9RHOB|nr:putative transcriptional regulatory protein TcrX [Roseibaca ekhonensis]
MVQKRVLVIEDEPNISEAIRFILTRNGWQVDVEADGFAALARLRSAPPDALILDLMLPDMDGFEILRNLRAEAPTRDLPVLMLTAKGQVADRDLAAKLGVTRFMTKPFANAEVVSALHDMVAS